MLKKSKWNLLYFAVILLMLFTLFGVPRIAKDIMNQTKGRIYQAEIKENHQ